MEQQIFNDGYQAGFSDAIELAIKILGNEDDITYFLQGLDYYEKR